GETRLPSIRCTSRPNPTTANARPGPPDAPSTNSAGRNVETSVPKNGTMAATPAKMPNVSQYGTPNAQSPIVVSRPSSVIDVSWPTIQDRSVRDRSVSTLRTRSRCSGGNSAIRYSRYSPGCSVRYTPMIATDTISIVKPSAPNNLGSTSVK